MLSERRRRMLELGDEIAGLYSHISAALARWLRLLAEFDAEDGRNEGGFKSCAHWLSWRCGIDIRTAREHACVARRLGSRPLVKAVFERGELSYSKVRALLRPEDDFDEELMLMYANSASAAQLERIVRGCRRCVAIEQEAARQLAEREFHWHYDEDGAVVFGGRLPAELGAVVVRALEAARDVLGPPPPERAAGLGAFQAERSVSPRARNADALVALAQTKLAGGSAAPPSDCRLDDGSPLPTSAARRLACDGSIVRVLERDGKPLSLGRKTRTISPALRRALHIRDKTCMFPGCTQRHHTDGHHIEHWADGGDTELDNLLRLCRFHHVLVHEGGFDVKRTPRGGFRFYDPRGKVIPPAPRPLRGDCASIRRQNAASGVHPTGSTLFPEQSSGEGVNLAWTVDALLKERASP